MSGETSQPPIDYYVLRNGETAGPFAVEQLAAEFSAGRIEAGDFVQAVGEPDWQPLAHVLDVPGEELPEAIAPDWACILKWAELRLRDHIAEHTLIVGGICVGLGTLALALSHWPFVFWIPWLFAAAALGFVLIRGKRHAHGALLLGGALALPLLLAVFWPKARLTQAQPVEPPVHVAENAPAVFPAPPAPAPVPALPLPTALPPVATPDPASAVISGVAVATSAGPVTPQPAASAASPSPLRSAGEYIATSTTKLTDEFKSLFARFSKHSTPAPSSESNADSAQKSADAFVIVNGSNGSGSGFVCRSGNQTWLYSNIHVVAGVRDSVVTSLNGVAIVPGPGVLAMDADVARFALSHPPPHPLEMIKDFVANVHIGDAVVVLGNSGGGGVVTSLRGTILGIGPDRLEISAEFIPGNSGSPIIHVATGKVIGIATYHTRTYGEFSPGAGVVRRYGYRIDTIQNWEPVNWSEFYEEADAMGKISLLTADLLSTLKALRAHTDAVIATATVRNLIDDWNGKAQNPRMNPLDRQAAKESFLNGLRFLVRGDVQAAEGHFHYSYFRNKLRDEKEVRDRLYTAYESLIANNPNALNRPAHF